MSKSHFYNSAQFDFAEALGEHWRDIRAEYQGISEQLVDYGERKLYDEGWQVFALYAFPHGEAVAENVQRCPRTAAWVAEWFPSHGAAGFSVLRPGTMIRPHEGYQGNFLRCHLGLSVPEGDCGLAVEGEARRWREGEVLVFDDRLTHEAWNRTAEDRVILLVDFVPDRTRPFPTDSLADRSRWSA